MASTDVPGRGVALACPAISEDSVMGDFFVGKIATEHCLVFAVPGPVCSLDTNMSFNFPATTVDKMYFVFVTTSSSCLLRC